MISFGLGIGQERNQPRVTRGALAAESGKLPPHQFPQHFLGRAIKRATQQYCGAPQNQQVMLGHNASGAKGRWFESTRAYHSRIGLQALPGGLLRREAWSCGRLAREIANSPKQSESHHRSVTGIRQLGGTCNLKDVIAMIAIPRLPIDRTNSIGQVPVDPTNLELQVLCRVNWIRNAEVLSNRLGPVDLNI